MTKRLFLSAIALLFFTDAAVAAKDEIYSSLFGGAIRGYDPVAYFTQGKPVKGDSKHQAKYKGATWNFSSVKNKGLFEQAPEKYVPKYGGYCAYAVSQGYTAPIDPEAWSIVDDKLYLNYSKDVRATWGKDIPGNIKKANANWPKVLAN